MKQLVDVSHHSKRVSHLRMTLHKKVQEKLGVKEGRILRDFMRTAEILL
jgi:hypothetical protein